MKSLEEIRILKKELRLLKTRINKLEKSNEQMKTLIKRHPEITRKKQKNLGYYNWMENERRMKNLILPEV